MRKIVFFSIGTILFFLSCQKTDSVQQEISEQTSKDRSCATQQVLQAALAADPGLAARMDGIAGFTRRAIAERRIKIR